MNANLVRLAVVVGTAASLVVFQQTIPIRQLAPAEATSTQSVYARASARELSDGHVIVADQQMFKPKMFLFDHTLGEGQMIADSNTVTAGSFRAMTFTTVRYLGDSTLLADPNGNSLLVIDPAGKVARVMALPKAAEVRTLSPNTGAIGLDARGRLVYRGTYPRVPAPLRPPGTSGPTVTSISQSDSFPLVRADFETRVTDTLATLHAPIGVRAFSIVEDNKVTMRSVWTPYPTTDAWAVLSDGAVAIVRGHDYHVDWILADGSRASTPKMPFDWRPISDEVKQHVVDSVGAMFAKSKARQDSIAISRGQKPNNSFLDEVAPAKELPDYYPPLYSYSAIGDLDGNLWVLPTTSSQARGGLLYDVVNRKGEVFERIQLPGGCGLAGFGAKSAVYITCPQKLAGDTASKTVLMRTHIVRPTAKGQHN